MENIMNNKNSGMILTLLAKEMRSHSEVLVQPISEELDNVL
jgi:hypothetical protein